MRDGDRAPAPHAVWRQRATGRPSPVARGVSPFPRHASLFPNRGTESPSQPQRTAGRPAGRRRRKGAKHAGPPTARLMQRAVKPPPSGGRYKAHLDWDFDFSAFCVLTGDTAAGHAVSACGEIVRPGGIGGWFVPVKFPTWECLRRKPSLVPLGSLGEAGTRSGTQSQDCLRWESPDVRRGRMSSKTPSDGCRKASQQPTGPDWARRGLTPGCAWRQTPSAP